MYKSHITEGIEEIVKEYFNKFEKLPEKIILNQRTGSTKRIVVGDLVTSVNKLVQSQNIPNTKMKNLTHSLLNEALNKVGYSLESNSKSMYHDVKFAYRLNS